jgi:hypothetical protein
LVLSQEYGQIEKGKEKEKPRGNQAKFKKEPSPLNAKLCKLPYYFRPCNTIMEQIAPVLNAAVSGVERKEIEAIMRIRIRKGIAMSFKKESFLPAERIVEIYRSRYPQYKDNVMVANIVTSYRLSHVTCSNTTIPMERVSTAAVPTPSGPPTASEATPPAEPTMENNENDPGIKLPQAIISL